MSGYLVNDLRDPFTMIDNRILRDPRITTSGKLVFIQLKSRNTGWNFSATRMAEEHKEGRRKILTCLKELEEIGLLVREKQADGRVSHTLKDIYSEEAKSALREKAIVPKAHDAVLGPIIKKEIIINNNKEKKIPPEKSGVTCKEVTQDYKIARRYFKRVLEDNPKTTVLWDPVKWEGAVRSLNKKYSHDQIKKALVYASENPFWKANCRSLPALLKRSKNGLTKFENLYNDLTLRKGKEEKRIEKMAPAIPLEDEFDQEDKSQRRIINSLTEHLQDKFHSNTTKRSDILALTNRLYDISDGHILYKLMSGKLVGLHVAFENGKPIEQNYMSFVKKVRGDLDYLSWKDLEYGSDIWKAFERSFRTYGFITSVEDALASNNVKSLKKYHKKYDKTYLLDLI